MSFDDKVMCLWVYSACGVADSCLEANIKEPFKWWLHCSCLYNCFQRGHIIILLFCCCFFYIFWAFICGCILLLIYQHRSANLFTSYIFFLWWCYWNVMLIVKHLKKINQLRWLNLQFSLREAWTAQRETICPSASYFRSLISIPRWF